MTQDIYYLDPSYFAGKYFVYTADADARLNSQATLVADGRTHAPQRFQGQAALQSQVTLASQLGARKPLVAYTIFTPVIRTVFSGLTNGVTT